MGSIGLYSWCFGVYCLKFTRLPVFLPQYCDWLRCWYFCRAVLRNILYQNFLFTGVVCNNYSHQCVRLSEYYFILCQQYIWTATLPNYSCFLQVRKAMLPNYSCFLQVRKAMLANFLCHLNFNLSLSPIVLWFLHFNSAWIFKNFCNLHFRNAVFGKSFYKKPF